MPLQSAFDPSDPGFDSWAKRNFCGKHGKRPTCIGTTSLLMAQSTALAGNWRLANMTEDPTPTPMVPAGELTVEFAGDRISGSGGCNRFTGSFNTEGNQLQVSPLASTFKACEQSIMDQETRYLTALQGAQRYELDDQGQLTIFYQTEQTSGVLRFTNQTVRGMW
ncbi:MAG: META domain-containing protein [Leptolyngbya sp. IPPAS B-1204]